ncbi:MAG: hypothetical protein IKA23_04060 [Akkermansia sp.]|nr:hypothetical protein [Akkermansia sp.]
MLQNKTTQILRQSMSPSCHSIAGAIHRLNVSGITPVNTIPDIFIIAQPTIESGTLQKQGA